MPRSVRNTQRGVHRPSPEDLERIRLQQLLGDVSTSLEDIVQNDIIDVGANATEVNLLDISLQGPTIGQALLSDGGGVASWQDLPDPMTFGAYQGEFDASIGTFPVTLNMGDWFNCTVAGTVDGQAFIIGDLLIALVDTPSTTVFAANWTIVPNISVTDHTLLTNIGVNTHAQVDTHIADTDIHFSDAPSDGETYVRVDAAWVRESGVGGLLSSEYRFSTSIVAADPGSGRFRYDHATPGSVTEIYIDVQNNNGFDISNILALIADGDRLYIQATDASQFQIWNVTADAVDNTGWFTIAVELVVTGTALSNAARCVVVLQVDGADVVTKVGTPLDNEVAVWTGDGTLEGDANLIWDGVTLSIINAAGAAAVTVNANNPQVRFQENDAIVDEGNWRVIANNSRWRLQTVTDFAPTAGAATAFGIERTGTVVDSFDIDAPVFSNTGNFEVGTEILFAERGTHVFTPVGGRGILWARNDTPNVLVYTDDAGTDWDLSVAAGDVFKVGTPVNEEYAMWTGDGTLSSNSDITNDGTFLDLNTLIVRVTQFFRSRGFDDRATARRCLLFNNVTQWGPADNDEYSFTRVLETGSMGAAGGSGKTGGGNFIFRGDAHASLPGDFSMRSGLGVWLRVCWHKHIFNGHWQS